MEVVNLALVHVSVVSVMLIDDVTYVRLLADGFSRSWDLLLSHIESSALCHNAEVSLAALKSLQEMLQIRVAESNGARDEWRQLFENPHRPNTSAIAPPSVERISRTGSVESEKTSPVNIPETPVGGEGGAAGDDDDVELWLHAFKVWLKVGTVVTTPPTSDVTSSSQVTSAASAGALQLYVPAQAFLVTLVQIFAPLYSHVRARFDVDDLRRTCHVLQQVLVVPVHSDSSPFILPVGDVGLTNLQQAALDAFTALQKVSYFLIKHSIQ